jgi:hypothetical protein
MSDSNGQEPKIKKAKSEKQSKSEEIVFTKPTFKHPRRYPISLFGEEHEDEAELSANLLKENTDKEFEEQISEGNLGLSEEIELAWDLANGNSAVLSHLLIRIGRSLCSDNCRVSGLPPVLSQFFNQIIEGKGKR